MLRGGLTYFVVGIGGDRLDPFASSLDPYSQVRYNATYGALRIDATATNIIFRCINRTNAVIDTVSFEALPAKLEIIRGTPPVQIQLDGSPGQNYITEASANLDSWVSISTNAPGASRRVVVTDSGSSMYPPRFYRARIGH
jgi:hypothetical protein